MVAKERDALNVVETPAGSQRMVDCLWIKGILGTKFLKVLASVSQKASLEFGRSIVFRMAEDATSVDALRSLGAPILIAGLLSDSEG